MSPRHQKLIDQAMALPPDERADLAERLWASLEGEQRRQIETAWSEEVERRSGELAAGKVKPIPADEVLG